MRKVIKDESISKDDCMDECCNIAESIMDEINLISLADRKADGILYEGKQKGSLKKLMRQIKQARHNAIG